METPHKNSQFNRTLTELTQLSLQTLSVIQFADSAIVLTQQALEVDYLDLWEFTDSNQRALLRAAAGRQASLMGLTLPLKQVVTAELTLIVEAPALPQWFQQQGVISSMQIPVQDSERSFGVLWAHSETQRQFSASEVLFLQAIANLFTLVLTRQQAEAVKIANQVLEKQLITSKKVEDLLRESEERYALAANAANDGVWDWNLQTDELYFSPRWKHMLGYEEDEISNHLSEWLNRIHPDDLESFNRTIADRQEGTTSHFEIQYRLLHKDGTYRWMLSRGLVVRDATRSAYRLAGTQSDITVRKDSEDRMLYNALHDKLTGLANRTLFMDRLEHAAARTKRYEDYKFAVAFLDLDRFKIINDSLGHLAGDYLLTTVAQRLRDCIRVSDTCARLAGDEFAVLLEYTERELEVIKTVERLQERLRVPIQINGREVLINASIGIVFSTAHYEQPEDLLRDADTAMYRAKALGKGRYAVFTQEMHEHAVTLLQLETDLRRALQQQEFVVFYQPVVDMRTSQFIGFEALLRWQHPQRGLVSPGEFIPLAEETGLIVPIGQWVIQEACQQIQRWQQQYSKPILVSVNISRKQFSQPDLVHQIQQILEETKLEPQYLKLEITESAIMENVNAATAMMQQLKTIGVQLALDDFGTGYSSLSQLHLFPIDTLKIDPSFTHAVDSDFEKIELIRSVVKLAWNLGIDVIAEGVETQMQMSQLKLLNCDLAQGYLFSRPLSNEAITALLADEFSS